MCGIVFVGGTALSSTNLERFEQMLYADVFRGDHSTGVMAYYKPYQKEALIKVAKKAVPSDIFLRSNLWKDIAQHRAENISATGVKTTSVTYPRFIVGHNRYATAGAVVDKNAHPFQCGHITLVHNGSLLTQSLLPDSEKFDVDSENICHSIATIGIEETIKKLHGAFVLVWHDAKLNTLNFLRNDERPFYMMKTTGNDWYGASEKDMLKWIMSRKKWNPVIEKEFELEVGTQYVFDSTDGLVFKEEIKRELPVFQSVYQSRWSSSYQSYDDYYSDRYDTYGSSRVYNNVTIGSNSRSNIEPSHITVPQSVSDKYKQLNELMEAHQVAHRIHERVVFEAYQYEPYPKNPQKGQLTGWIGEGAYIEVQGHGVPLEMYTDGGMFEGKIISCYESNFILTIIVSEVKPRDETLIPLTELDDDDISNIADDILEEFNSIKGKTTPALSLTPPGDNIGDFSDLEEEEDDGYTMDTTRDGTVVTKKEWEGNVSYNCCGNCGSPIPFDFVADSTIYHDYAYCGGCVDAGLVEGVKSSTGDSLRFDCINCQEELPVDAESEVEGLCLQCHGNKHLKSELKALQKEIEDVRKSSASNVRPILTYRKSLQNGMKVTLVQWNAMNSCSFCDYKIPFNKAAVTEFIGSTPCCERCSKVLETGKVPGKVSNNK